MPEKEKVLTSDVEQDVFTSPCDLCGEIFPLLGRMPEKFPWEITIRHNGERAYSESKIRLCQDCFDSLKMEYDRLKKLS